MVRQEGQRQVNRHIDHYSLHAILALGYRVRSQRGTQFRRRVSERRMYLRVRENFAVNAPTFAGP